MVNPLLDLVLQGEVTEQDLKEYTEATFLAKPKNKQPSTSKREAETQTEELLEEEKVKQDNGKGSKRQKQAEPVAVEDKPVQTID